MIFEQRRAGGDRNFSYLIGDEAAGVALLVDPAGAPERALERSGELGLEIETIVHTHGHADHTAGTAELRHASGAEVLAFAPGPDVTRTVADGDEIAVGALRLRVIHTPGHTPDSICLYGHGQLVTGDTLFVGKVGGTGHGEDARQEYASLHEKLMILPEDTAVWPGHDYGVRPSSTIGAEKRENPFLLRPDFAAFVELKKNWLAYKREHGIQ